MTYMVPAFWTLVGLLAVAFLIRVAFVARHPERYGRGMCVVDAETVGDGPYPYVYIEENGDARELHPAERAYLEQRFQPGDGARPTTKWRYGSRSLDGRRDGFLKRSRLPRTLEVGPAPLLDPNPPLSRAEMRAQMEREGWETVDNPDGSYTAYPRKKRRRHES